MRLAIGSTKHMSDNQLVLVFVAEVFVAVLIQGCLAVVATSKADVMPIAQGVGAALLAGSLMAVETFWINVAGGGHVVPAFAWTLLTTTLCAGAPVALTLAWVTTLLTKRTGGT
jgi:hypothetical protein